MRCRMVPHSAALLVLLASCGSDELPPPPPAPEEAHDLEESRDRGEEAGEEDSRYGIFSLDSHFSPDPYILQGTSGGEVRASERSPSCRGWISKQPDHTFRAEEPFVRLRFVVHGGDQDTTLMVGRPDGSYACSDDGTDEAKHPVVEGNFDPGVHRIWVGSYQQGVRAAYNLGVTQKSGVDYRDIGTPGAATSQGSMNSTHGTITLSPGFRPDPHVVLGDTGGRTPAGTRDVRCQGWISERPDHIFVAGASFGRLRFLVRPFDAVDTTLVVEKPDGTYLCIDDVDGQSPIVDGPVREGTYRIWVGHYQRSGRTRYRLAITERPDLAVRDVH